MVFEFVNLLYIIEDCQLKWYDVAGVAGDVAGAAGDVAGMAGNDAGIAYDSD
jgi:hypothetical protein